MANDLTPIQIITQVATGLGVPVSLALAIAQQESGMNPNSVGDNGTSFGLYNLHKGGELGNMKPTDVMGTQQGMFLNAYTALSQVAHVLKANPSATPGDVAAMAQRPENPGAYAASINALLSFNGPATSNYAQPQQGNGAMQPSAAGLAQLNAPVQTSLPASSLPLAGGMQTNPLSGAPTSPLGGATVSPLGGAGITPLGAPQTAALGNAQITPTPITNPSMGAQAGGTGNLSKTMANVDNFFSYLGVPSTKTPPPQFGTTETGASLSNAPAPAQAPQTNQALATGGLA